MFMYFRALCLYDTVFCFVKFNDLRNLGCVKLNNGIGCGFSRDAEAMAHARVDIRKLQQFLMGQQVNPNKSMCNIVDKRIIHLILLQEDVSLQYFIPAVA
uniref:Uncharacterized protein n=1 Tax=Astyanax mexicanus TaxID=7994 RepID=A0A8B9GZ60_ASTMX